MSTEDVGQDVTFPKNEDTTVGERSIKNKTQLCAAAALIEQENQRKSL